MWLLELQCSVQLKIWDKKWEKARRAAYWTGRKCKCNVNSYSLPAILTIFCSSENPSVWKDMSYSKKGQIHLNTKKLWAQLHSPFSASSTRFSAQECSLMFETRTKVRLSLSLIASSRRLVLHFKSYEKFLFQL